MEDKVLKFTTKLKSYTIEIDGDNYKMVELDGERRSDYNQKSMDRMEISGREVVGMKDMKGIEMDILELTIYKPSGELISRNELQKWPYSVLQELASVSMELSGIRVPGTKEKNDLGAKSSTGTNSPAG